LLFDDANISLLGVFAKIFLDVLLNYLSIKQKKMEIAKANLKVGFCISLQTGSN